MTTKLIVIISIIVTFIVLSTITISNIVSFSNEEITLCNLYKQKIDERTTFYDKMWKSLAQKSQIALRNDSSFRQNVEIIMSNRKDSEKIFFKWVTESNPNANYSEVSALYKDLSRSVEAQREGFFTEEKYLQDIVLQHSNLINKFPGSLYNWFLNRKSLVYKPITSDKTDEVMKTGKENSIKLEL
jgi:hypothetical protein